MLPLQGRMLALFDGAFALNGNVVQFTLNAVPEPSAVALLGAGYSKLFTTLAWEMPAALMIFR